MRRIAALLPVILVLAFDRSGLAQEDGVTARPRARQAGVVFGRSEPGPHNAITDVAGVRVGHATVRAGDSVRTGVTVVLPHGGNPFQDRVPAAVCVQNGFGKLVGTTQIEELGELESPIALTNTLNVGLVMDALVGWSLEQPGNERVRSVNVVVGETNDGRLNDIRGRHVHAEHVRAALESASDGAVTEGCVGAGTGTVCLGYKGGIGTSSRRVGDYTVGVLVQTNYGGDLTIGGVRLGSELRKAKRDGDERGSCMIVIATDAPLSSRNLKRLARRSFAGMARTGASFSNGSGDYAIAFCTAEGVRIPANAANTGGPVVANSRMSPLLAAVADATEEAIVNSLFAAETTTGNGRTVKALPVERVVEILQERR